jgi:hypothetical protein
MSKRIGDTIIEPNGTEYEVVWEGGEGLVGPRQHRVSEDWVPPKRLYNKTGKYSKKTKPEPETIKIVNPLEED